MIFDKWQCISGVKGVRIWRYSDPYFPAFALNTERYSVSLRIQSECGKRRTKQTLNTVTFHSVIYFGNLTVNILYGRVMLVIKSLPRTI